MSFIGFAAKLELDPGTGSFAVVDQATMITLPAQETASVDTSHLNLASPNRTFTPGLTDGGSLEFECNYTKATFTQLNTVKGKLKITTQIPATGGTVNWRITGVDEDGAGSGAAPTWAFNGFLTKLDTSFDENVIKIKGSVKVSGAVTYTAGA